MENVSLIDLAENNELEKMRRLLTTSINVNQLEYGRSALHSACMSNAIAAAELLTDSGINVNLRDHGTGATPLHYCGVYNRFELAKLILKKGGDLNLADNYGNQPLWTAVFNVKGKLERLGLVELFLDHGADKNHVNNAGRSPLDFANQVKFAPLLDLLNKYQ